MKYEYSEELQKKAEEISKMLFPHVKIDKIKCYKSYGTSSRGTIARCHALGKLMQKALDVEAFYALEFITERFDKLDEEDKLKVIIHELMHIPFTFGGGFKHHDVVNTKTVNKAYEEYKKLFKTTQKLEETQITLDENKLLMESQIVKRKWFNL
jgi:predicted metallopeptidase